MKERGGVKRDVGNGAFLPHLLNSGPKGDLRTITMKTPI